MMGTLTFNRPESRSKLSVKFISNKIVWHIGSHSVASLAAHVLNKGDSGK